MEMIAVMNSKYSGDLHAFMEELGFYSIIEKLGFKKEGDPLQKPSIRQENRN